MKITTKKQYKKAVKELHKHDELYYQKCKPKISDYEYDQLLKAVQKYEEENPQEKEKASPSARIGEKTTKGFKQAEHKVAMLSLANTYSEKELEDFIHRIYKLLKEKDTIFCAELKIDGTAVSVRYEKGKLTRAVTRGTGKKGDVVTDNIKTIKSLPMTLKGKNIPDVLEIRGEVFISKKVFENLNKQRKEKGLDLWANPRNAAAGSLKLLNPKEVEKRHLNIIFYNIAEGAENVTSQFQIHKYLKEFHLPVSEEKHFAKCHNLKDILHFADKIQKQREKLDFEIDGIVVKVDDITQHKKLGRTGKSPRYAVAYKFAPESAYTQIEDITVQVGRTGVLTPVAELKPVLLAGSTISRATLHNADEVKRKDIRIGDWVSIEKGGDVIPKVVKVDLKRRKKEAKVWHMPHKCPICHSDVKRTKEEVAVRCSNPKCAGKKLRRLVFFASKQAMDIDHMGEKVVQQLVDKELISRPSDIYTLDEAALSTLEGFKEKSIQNLLESIDRSRDCTLAQFIMGLEIKYVGKETAELLAEEAGDIETLSKIKKEDLIEIEGIGEKVADSIEEYFQDKQNMEEIHLLLKQVHPKLPRKKKSAAFAGKIFVLTGALEKYTRDEASALIKERGGKTSSSVSAKTDFVLCGEDPGSKYKKAVKLGVKVISEKEFEKML